MIRITLSELVKTKRYLPDPERTRYAKSIVPKSFWEYSPTERMDAFEKVQEEIEWEAWVGPNGWTWITKTPLEIVLE